MKNFGYLGVSLLATMTVLLPLAAIAETDAMACYKVKIDSTSLEAVQTTITKFTNDFGADGVKDYTCTVAGKVKFVCQSIELDGTDDPRGPAVTNRAYACYKTKCVLSGTSIGTDISNVTDRFKTHDKSAV